MKLAIQAITVLGLTAFVGAAAMFAIDYATRGLIA